MDFAEEPGVAEAAAPQIDRNIRALLKDILGEVNRSAGSELLRDGFRVVLAGHPNTGKSSLLNALARREAAIVSDIPGTTRDAIEVTLDLDGIPVIVTDTAGLRSDGADAVEREGMRRSRQHISGADLVVWVWSADVPQSDVPESPIRPDLLVQNKSDLPDKSELMRNDRAILTSCQTREHARFAIGQLHHGEKIATDRTGGQVAVTEPDPAVARGDAVREGRVLLRQERPLDLGGQRQFGLHLLVPLLQFPGALADSVFEDLVEEPEFLLDALALGDVLDQHHSELRLAGRVADEGDGGVAPGIRPSWRTYRFSSR